VDLRADLTDMVESALHVSNHGEELALKHQTTDGQIASAQGGWAGSSAMAMAERASRWTQTSAAILARVSDHSQGLHATAHAFTSMEDENSNHMQALSNSADTAMGSAADKL
jgi:uncharacterized protein YukE